MNTTRRQFLTCVLGAAVTTPLLACAAKPEPQYHVGMDPAGPGSDTTDHCAEHVVRVGARPNVVYVSWLDRDGRIRTESVLDIESVYRDGCHPITVAYCCASREQAMRHGRWVLIQERIKS